MNTSSKSGVYPGNRQNHAGKADHLFPAALPKKLPLVEGVRKLIEAVNTHCPFHVDLIQSGFEHEKLKEPVRSAVYQIVKAQIKNILKQGQATAATVYLAKNHERLAIVVEDNGTGVDVPRMKNSRYFKYIQTLVEEHRGRLNFFQQAAGTILQVLIIVSESQG